MVQQSKCGIIALLPVLFMVMSPSVQSQGLIERRSPNPFPSPDASTGKATGAEDPAAHDQTAMKGMEPSANVSSSLAVPLNGLANSTLSSNASSSPTSGSLAGGASGTSTSLDTPLNTTKGAAPIPAGTGTSKGSTASTTSTTSSGNSASGLDSKTNGTSTDKSKSGAKSAASHLYGLSSSVICVLNLSVLLVLFA